MSKSSFEEEIQHSGYLLYRSVGDSMLPIIRQGRKLILISRKPEGRLKKYDVPLYRVYDRHHNIVIWSLKTSKWPILS